MTANDIQELLDGTLPDEVSAELLHKLSISPEHRTTFQQHLALRTAFEQDRAENAMQPDEDAMVWAGIVGSVPPAVAPVATGFGLWRMAAVVGTVAALVVGAYMLGSGSSDKPADVVVNNRPLNLPALTTTFDALGIGGERNTNSSSSSNAQSALSNLTAAAPQTLWRDRIVYRDRVVYRDRPEANRNDALASRSLTDRSLAANGSSTSSASNSSDGVDRVSLSNASSRSISDLFANAVAPRRASSMMGRKGGVSLDAKHTTLDPLPSQGSQFGDLADSPLLKDGFEVSYTERLGQLGSLPQGTVNNAAYATRAVGGGYHMATGPVEIGMGARIGVGTFPMVSLEPTQRVRREGTQSRIDTLYVPTVEARSQQTVEMYFNGRWPIFDRLAIGAELAYNNSVGNASQYSRIGADLNALWLLTDRIGLQGGIGIGSYSYDLTGSRESLLQSGENVGVSDDALDSYKGTVVEGRYGVVVRF